MNTPITSVIPPVIPPVITTAEESPLKKLPHTLIAVVGPSGTGKSMCLRNLPQDRIIILDLERKGMPFKIKNPACLVQSTSWANLLVQLRNASKNPNIDIIVIDSITRAIELIQTHCEQQFKGFEIWKNYNDMIGDLLYELKSYNKTVILTSLEEIVQIQGMDGSLTTRRRMFVQGKEWANRGIESECLAVWTCFARRDKESGKIAYMFASQTDGVTLAKTPPFWNLPEFMPNDISVAVATIIKNC